MSAKLGSGSKDQTSRRQAEQPDLVAEQQRQPGPEESTTSDPGVEDETATSQRPMSRSGLKNVLPATRTQRVITGFALAFLVGSIGYLSVSALAI